MDRPPIDTEQQGTTVSARWRVDLRLTVWSAEDGWHALLSGIGMAPREFASPFELARFVSWPVADMLRDERNGLR